MKEDFEQLKSELNQYRVTRRGRTHYPADLRRKTVSLLKHFSITELSNALEIRAVSLSRWQKAFALDPEATELGFIKVPVAPHSQGKNSVESGLAKFTIAGVISLELTHYSASELVILMSQLAKELKSCCC